MLEKTKVFTIFGTACAIFIVLAVGIMALAIFLAVRKRKRFNAFLTEPLTDHLDDPLNSDRFEDWREKKIDVYIYGRLAKYAEQAAFESIPKRKRFDKEGQYTDTSQKKIAENMYALMSLFTKQDGYALSSEFCYFITEYRPYYTVGDFEKSIMEFFSFKTNPELFEKPAVPEEQPEAPVQGIESDNVPLSPFVHEEEVEEYEEIPEESEPVKNYDPYYNPYKNVVVHFSPTVTVDHSVMNELQLYADKLAKNTCGKKGISERSTDGSVSPEYKELCRNNYNKLCRMFFSEMRFKKEFVEWVNEFHSNMDDVSMFGELIPMYIRHIKGKD